MTREKKSPDEDLTVSREAREAAATTVAPDASSVAVEDAPQSTAASDTTVFAPDRDPDLAGEPVAPWAKAVEPEVQATAARAARGGAGFVAALLGGALAFGGGFAASHFDLVSLAKPVPSIDVSRYDAMLRAQDVELSTMRAALAEVTEQTQTGLGRFEGQAHTLGARLDKLDAALAAQGAVAPDGRVTPAALAALTARVEALAQAPQAAGGAGLDAGAVEALVGQALDARMADVRAEAEVQAEALRAEVRREQAVVALGAALRDGVSYEALLEDVPADEVPDILRQHAATGVPSLHDLTAAFPAAARAALEASLRAAPEAGFGERLWSFVRISVGARALAPQEGADPDAILSRAEAAVQQGDLAAALAEVATLPEAGQAALADWSAQAALLREAGAALVTLTK